MLSTAEPPALGRNEKTKVIAVVNPNNPTGHIFTETEMQRIIAAAERVGAWVLADEVYRGAERGHYHRVPARSGERGDPRGGADGGQAAAALCDSCRC